MPTRRNLSIKTRNVLIWNWYEEMLRDTLINWETDILALHAFAGGQCVGSVR